MFVNEPLTDNFLCSRNQKIRFSWSRNETIFSASRFFIFSFYIKAVFIISNMVRSLRWNAQNQSDKSHLTVIHGKLGNQVVFSRETVLHHSRITSAAGLP